MQFGAADIKSDTVTNEPPDGFPDGVTNEPPDEFSIAISNAVTNVISEEVKQHPPQVPRQVPDSNAWRESLDGVNRLHVALQKRERSVGNLSAELAAAREKVGRLEKQLGEGTADGHRGHRRPWEATRGHRRPIGEMKKG